MIGIGREMHKTPHMAHAVKLIIVIIFYNVFAFNDAKLLGAKTEFHHQFMLEKNKLRIVSAITDIAFHCSKLELK